MVRRLGCGGFVLCCLFLPPVCGQDNYEIQVYGSETVAPRRTMFETHTNFIFQGSKVFEGSMRPTNHALHETFEITQGLNNWSEVGFYFFTSASSQFGWNYVGSHIRPRVRVPPGWHWPVGVSLSSEFGYQRAAYSPDTWTLEIRPIVDKQLGPVYLAVNPTFEKSLHGATVPEGWTFSPNAKVSCDVTKKIALGLEYYGNVGTLTGFFPAHDQEQMLIPVIDVDFGPNWEFNFGVGVGLTSATDHLLVKMIIGRRFSWGHKD